MSRRLGVGTAVDAAADHVSNMVSKHSLSSAEETSVFDADSFPSAKGSGLNPRKLLSAKQIGTDLLAETRRRAARSTSARN